MEILSNIATNKGKYLLKYIYIFHLNWINFFFIMSIKFLLADNTLILLWFNNSWLESNKYFYLVDSIFFKFNVPIYLSFSQCTIK